MRPLQSRSFLVPVSGGQGLYYLLTGLWSLVSIETFQAVTGPKTDIWLVKTVGVLVMVSGAVLLLAAYRRVFTPEVMLLGLGQALMLAVIDFTYVGIGRISFIYFFDGLVEVALTILWSVGWYRSRR